MVKLPLRSWPKRKFAPTHTSDTRSHSTSTVRTNVSGSHCDSSRVKRTTATQWMPALAERVDPLLLRHQQRRRLVGADDLRRVRIEGHRHGDAAVLDGAALHALDDLEMSAVQAVEVAEREHGMHEPRRPRIVGKMQDLHAGYDASTRASSTRPSYASSTPARQARVGLGVPEVVRHVREVGALAARSARSPRAPRRR